MDKLLAICIPTYNRANMLKEVLDKLIPTCARMGVSIFVSDNASPDNTKEVMEAITKQCQFIHYHRHNENIGPDDNFEYVLKMPNSKYRWLLSDTCYFENIDEVVEDLQKKEWDGYILRGEAPRYPFKKTIYDNSIDVMRDLARHLSWISCMIYNERLVHEMNFIRYKNSSFNQTALMFEPTANRKVNICFNHNVKVFALPTLKISAWQWHVFDIFYRQWWEMIMSLPIYYPYNVKAKAVLTTGGVNTIHAHLIRRAGGKWSFRDLWKNRFFVKKCGSANYYKLIAIGICPRFIIKGIMDTGRYFKHIIKRTK